MNRKRQILLALILVFVRGAGLRADDIDDYIRSEIQRQHIPGVAIAVIKNGSVVKSEAYGLASIEHGIPATIGTVFQIGSLSKQFIATGIMLLVQDRKVALDGKISMYLEGTPVTWDSITVRHLLTHTSGLMREAPGFDPYKLQPDIDVIRTAYSRPLLFKTGEKYEYSNLGYYVLAEIIRTASGKPWNAFLKERVFDPLGMRATRPTSVADVVTNRAAGYEWNGSKFENSEHWLALRPSGAFMTTVEDLTKWEAALRTDRILTASSKSAMWTWVKLNDGSEFPYGFGWQLNDWPADSAKRTGVPMIRHGGSIPGFRASFAMWPSQNLSVIILTNRNEANIDGMLANIAIRAAPQLRTVP